MSIIKRSPSAILSLLLALVLVVSMVPAAFAAETTPAAGTYTVDVGLNLFCTAMGGVYFNKGLMTTETSVDESTGTSYGTATAVVDEEGNVALTLNFTKGSFSYMGISTDTALVASDATKPGFYAQDGSLNTEDVSYTTSSMVLNSSNSGTKSIEALSSVTLNLDRVADSYTMWLYIDSCMMGVQFCDGTGTAGSNKPGESTPYTATLTVDWDFDGEQADETSTQSANVSLVYEASGAYEVSIPATINVDKATMTASYTVEAKEFDIDDNAYVTVKAATDGILTNGDGDTTTFTNTLADGKLSVTGDTLAGTVSVEKPSAHGTFAGTITFTINYFSGK